MHPGPVLAVASLFFAAGCAAIDRDDSLDDIDDETVVRVLRSSASRTTGDTLDVTLDVDGLGDGSFAGKKDCPTVTASLAVDGTVVDGARVRGGVTSSTGGPSFYTGRTATSTSCASLRFAGTRTENASASTTLTIADAGASWTIRIDELPSAAPTVTRDGEGVLREGDELRVRITPAPAHVENLRIAIVSGDDRAAFARWVAPDVVAFPMPRVLLDRGRTEQDLHVRIAIRDAFRPHVASCEGPAKCVLDARDPVLGVTGEIVVPYAGTPWRQ